MTARGHLSSWRSDAAEERFRRLEDEVADAAMTEVPEPLDVATRLGPTRAYRWTGDGTPVLFLHGASGTALTWIDYAERRAGRVAYAVDTIGDVGRSRQEVPVEGPGDLADWLDEVLDGLGLDAVHLVGLSYGGFLALNLAARSPARVRSLALVEPGGVVPVRLGRFLAWGTACFVASLLPGPLRRLAARPLRMPALADRRLLRVAFYGQRHHRTRMYRPEPLPADALRAIRAPALVVLGAKSEVFPPRQVRARLEEHLPSVEVEWVQGAGHAVSTGPVDALSARIVEFLAWADEHPTE